MKMTFLKKITCRFTARGKALAQVDRGMVCAKKMDSDNAVRYYSVVIDSPASPRDVQAMALVNRALMYTTMGQESQATRDLNSVLRMPESIAKIKKSASDKLVRMQRKLARKETPNVAARPNSQHLDPYHDGKSKNQ